MPKKTIICRCEDLALEEIQEWINRGYRDIEEIKRLTRAGMGPCQGRTCRAHILRELVKATGLTHGDGQPSCRPPVKPVSLKTLTRCDCHD